MAAAAANFALAPGLHDPNNIIDYSDRNGKILWKQATDPLAIQYDGSTELMRPFQDAFKTRALDHGWDDPLTITIGQDAAGNNIDRSLLTHAGEVSLQAVRDNAINDYFQQQSRNAQRARQIHRCLQNSITSKVAKRLVPEASKYYLDPNTPDGPSYYKVILDTYDIQTEATPHQIRLKNQPKLSANKHPKSNPPTNRPPKKLKIDNSKWKWKEEPPKPGVMTRTHDGKTYHWCRHHKKWCLHTESECRLKDRQLPIKTQGMAAVFEDCWT